MSIFLTTLGGFDIQHTVVAGEPLWEWVKVLLVPFVLVGLGVWLPARQKRSEIELARHAEQVDALQTYMDKMSALLVDQRLRESQRRADSRKVARALTLTVIPELNGIRKAHVLRFLYEARLIRLTDSELPASDQPIVSLERADFSHLNMPRAFLEGAQLRKVNLRNASLVRARLAGADLTGADLTGADLSGADITGAVCSRDTLAHVKRDGLCGYDLVRVPGGPPESS